MKLFNVFPKETICLFLQFTSVFINIIPDAQVLYLPYTSFYSDQIPKVVTFGGFPVIYVSQYIGVQALGGAMGGMVIAWGT